MHKEKVLPSSLCKAVNESVAWLLRQDGIEAGVAMPLYFFIIFLCIYHFQGGAYMSNEELRAMYKERLKR